MASVFVILTAVSASNAPTLVRQILACKASDTPSRIATAPTPPVDPKHVASVSY